MSKQLVIDWQKDGILFARGSGRGGKIVLDQAFFQPVGEDENGRNVTVEEALHSAVSALGLKGDVTVIASRESVEMRTISVPKIDADELPDVIRFQAQRQMPSMTDNWAVDYVMLPPVPNQEMQTALVAGMSPAHVNEIERACHSAGLSVRNIVLRPIEIVRFAAESGRLDVTGPTMMVCVSGSAVELLILSEGQCVQVRGTRLPHEPDQMAAGLKGEIRRSMMAASSYMSGQSITDVLLLSTPAMADILDGVVAEATGATVTHLDPAVTLSAELGQQPELAAATQRLAAVAGAVAFESADKKTFFDFKNPKQRPPRKKNTGRIILYGGAAAALLLLGVGWLYTASSRLEQQAKDLRDQIAAKEEMLEVSNEKIKEWQQVEAFLNASPNWLDELAYLSENIPGSDEVILGLPEFTINQAGNGVIAFKMRANASETIGAFEQAVRNDGHMVQASNPSEVTQARDRYKWAVDEVVTITEAKWNALAAAKPNSTSPIPKADPEPADAAPAETDSKPAESAEPNADASDASDTRTEAAADSSPTDETSAGEQVAEPETDDAATAKAATAEAASSDSGLPPADAQPVTTPASAVDPAG